MRCSSCRRSFRPRSFNKGSLCPPCWRVRNRGPQLKSLFALFERLTAKPGTITRAVRFLGVSRSTIHRLREGYTDTRAENVLALDAFVRSEVVMRIAEKADGPRESGRRQQNPPAASTQSHRLVPETGDCRQRYLPNVAAKGEFPARSF
jgi:hypothetical protein